ncbi:MAG TPA: hypothetical protein DCF63_18900, partial [Planctomycetaceae bacterium]|nr:hypothetical protein [Planctomycetaceae bacterium]
LLVGSIRNGSHFDGANFFCRSVDAAAGEPNSVDRSVVSDVALDQASEARPLASCGFGCVCSGRNVSINLCGDAEQPFTSGRRGCNFVGGDAQDCCRLGPAKAMVCTGGSSR